MPFDADGREHPYFDKMIQSLVVSHHGDWMVSVSPMLFNDRVLLTHRDGYPWVCVAGFCYDRGLAAYLAAEVWNPNEEHTPKGYKKIAYDAREDAQ